jgi:hypothetical protein
MKNALRENFHFAAFNPKSTAPLQLSRPNPPKLITVVLWCAMVFDFSCEN